MDQERSGSGGSGRGAGAVPARGDLEGGEEVLAPKLNEAGDGQPSPMMVGESR